MIDFRSGGIHPCPEIYCDNCGAVDSISEMISFRDFWCLMSDCGWRTHKNGVCWEHKCPECVEEYNKGEYGDD